MIDEFLQIIQEGRVEDFTSKYRTKFSPEYIKRIISLVKPKYLEWVGRVMDGTNFEDNFRKLQTLLKRFDEISSNLPKTDIFQYKSLSELSTEIEKYQNKSRREVEVAEDTNLVYDDGRFVVVNPLTLKASCLYGKGTKWCTASSNSQQFSKYNEDGKLFYIIDRRLKQSDPLYKIALLKKFEGDEFFFDAQNTQFTKGWILQTPEYERIKEKINSYFQQEFQEQIKIFKDKELAAKEKKRLESLRERRRILQLEAEAEERRVEQEWSLSNEDIDDEGLKANALLKYLESESEIEIISPTESARLSELKIHLENLKEKETELEQSGQDLTELHEEIENVEDEISDLEEKVDVYILAPTGEYYNGTEFEILNPNLNDKRYAVFTPDEIQNGCEEYCEQLIDDIGIDGLNKDFASSYLDIQKIKDEAEEIYNDDVYNNPEVYLSDSDRELSNSQEKEIQYNQKKIEDAKNLIETLEEYDDESEDTQEKIQELYDEIEELESEITDIQDNPDGDYKSEAIDEKVEELVYEVGRDPEHFLQELGLNWENYIDKDELIEGMIDADGYGHFLNRYDGSADEIEVLDKTYWIIRID